MACDPRSDPRERCLGALDPVAGLQARHATAERAIVADARASEAGLGPALRAPDRGARQPRAPAIRCDRNVGRWASCARSEDAHDVRRALADEPARRADSIWRDSRARRTRG